MSLFFLIPLATALGAAYVCEKCHDEVATLTAVAAIVCLVLSLVLSPWPIQLFLLVFVLITTRQISPNSPKF